MYLIHRQRSCLLLFVVVFCMRSIAMKDDDNGVMVPYIFTFINNTDYDATVELQPRVNPGYGIQSGMKTKNKIRYVFAAPMEHDLLNITVGKNTLRWKIVNPGLTEFSIDSYMQLGGSKQKGASIVVTESDKSTREQFEVICTRKKKVLSYLKLLNWLKRLQ